MISADRNKQVLDPSLAHRKLRRMALEIAESNTGEDEIVVAAINGNGQVVAKILMEELKRNTPLRPLLTLLRMNKKDPLEVSMEPAINFENKVVLLVDDVANTGKTMIYALKPFLNTRLKKIQTLVLVERNHKLFPVQTDYAGLSLATTEKEYIAVETENDEISGAWIVQK